MKKLILTLFALVSFAIISNVQGQQVIDLTTGAGSLVPGNVDNNWTVGFGQSNQFWGNGPNPTYTTDPATGFTNTYVSNGITIYGGATTTYPSNNCGQWIAPVINAANNNIANGGTGIYVYRLFFELDECDVQSASLNLPIIGADNRFTGIRINGNSHPTLTLPLTPIFSFTPLNSYNTTLPTSLFQAGTNYIDFEIRNYDSNNNPAGAGPTPAAFLLCGNLTVNYGCCFNVDAGNDVSYCPPYNNIQPLVGNTVAGASYNWQMQDPTGAITYAGNSNTASLPANPIEGNYTFTYTIIDPTKCVKSDEVIVTFHPELDVEDNVLNFDECDDLGKFVLACPTNSLSNNYTYLWSNGGNGPCTLAPTNSSSSYNVTVTDPTTSCSKVVNVTVNMPANFNQLDAGFTAQVVNLGPTTYDVVLTANLTSSIYMHVWQLGTGNPVQTLSGSTHTFTGLQRGVIYTLQHGIKEPKGCNEWITESQTIFRVKKFKKFWKNTEEGDATYKLATEEVLSNENSISIYPNPTSGIFNVEFSQDTENTTVEVLNLMGKVIFNENVTTSKLTLDLSNEAKGIYLVKITTNGNTTIEKVVYQ
jgi:type IX secretion system substrate protein